MLRRCAKFHGCERSSASRAGAKCSFAARQGTLVPSNETMALSPRRESAMFAISTVVGTVSDDGDWSAQGVGDGELEFFPVAGGTDIGVVLPVDDRLPVFVDGDRGRDARGAGACVDDGRGVAAAEVDLAAGGIDGDVFPGRLAVIDLERGAREMRQEDGSSRQLCDADEVVLRFGGGLRP